ncbi:hypothetical protein BRADI_4g24953v3 [Brachypodium distachyon]|uniref:F-box domain-containing protein n=1 Tax=Brachypodium distachyon TaxID=15368 RepID=A0A0Q3EPG3_BRADI|nr:hypothetical protein BRADI_4g24953v3 [Brachypodium distachyon]
MDDETQAFYGSRGVDLQSLQLNLIRAFTCLYYYVLPSPPSFLSSPGAAPDVPPPPPPPQQPQAAVDRISTLPDSFLRRVVSLLPIEDGARTAALSRRWRGVWRAAPLVLADSDLLPAAAATAGRPCRTMLEVSPAESMAVADAVTRILAAHQGPIRYAHIVSCYIKQLIPGLLARWLHLLAINGVRELFLVNRPWPLNMILPVGFFGIATLTRLYLGAFAFPDTAALPPTVQFPHLEELGLLCVYIQNRDMEFVLARTPVLKTLCIQMNILMTRLRIVSRSLRCLHIIGGTELDVLMEDAPMLERVIMWSTLVRNGSQRKVIKIGCAPALTVLGYLEPALHVLEIGNTLIKDGTRASRSTMVPSVNILALRVYFGVHNNATMLSSFLRCFPNVKRLHLESDHKTVEPTCKLSVNFWQEGGAIECVQSHMEVMIFYGFQGAPNELSFLQYILESARMLKNLVVVFSKGSFTSKAKANKKLKPLFAGKWANQDCSLVHVESAVKEGDDRFWLNSESGSDFSIKDPFLFQS